MEDLKIYQDEGAEATVNTNPMTRLIDPELDIARVDSDFEGLSSDIKYLKSLFRGVLVLLLIVFIGIAISFFFSTGGHQNTPSKVDVLRRPCGNTPDKAKAAGCIFDIVSFCFLHPRCHDFELAAEFAAIEPWQWFKERSNESATIPREQVLTGEFDVSFVDYHYHIEHCLFMWRKLHRIVLRGR